MRSENLRRPLQPRRHPGSIQRHPAHPGSIQRHHGGTPATSPESPESPGHQSSTSFYGSVKSPSMHHRSLYLSF